MLFKLLLKLQKFSNAATGPSIFSVIQDSLRDLRSVRRTQKLNSQQSEDSRSTVLTETQETHISDISMSSDVDTNLQIPKPEEPSSTEIEEILPKSKSSC